MHFSLTALVQAVLLPQLVASYATRAAGQNQTYTIKNLTTTWGHNYVYNFAPASDASKPTLLLLHGYPSSRRDWEYQIAALTAEGYGVVAPDMLGFGESSKPTAIEAYRFKALSEDIIEILDAEDLQEVIGVGHDWGAGMLSQVTTWFPKRFTKLVFVSIPYFAPGVFFDIDAVNKAGIETLGFQPFGYWYFFNSYNAADLIEQHLESYFHLVFISNSSAWGPDFADIGAARAWLNANTTTPSPSWLPAGYKEDWLRQFSQPRVVASSLNYYKSFLRGVSAVDEATLTDEDRALRVPVLAVGTAGDQISPPEFQRNGTKPWAKAGFEQKIVDSGHWVALEKPEELAAILLEFASS